MILTSQEGCRLAGLILRSPELRLMQFFPSLGMLEATEGYPDLCLNVSQHSVCAFELQGIWICFNLALPSPFPAPLLQAFPWLLCWLISDVVPAGSEREQRQPQESSACSKPAISLSLECTAILVEHEELNGDLGVVITWIARTHKNPKSLSEK